MYYYVIVFKQMVVGQLVAFMILTLMVHYIYKSKKVVNAIPDNSEATAIS